MVAVHFIENNNVVLTQLTKQVPTVNEDIKIKGRKGKVLSVKNIDQNVIHVQVQFEQLTKSKVSIVDNKKKKR